jgi:hypothetical protein
MPFFIIFWGDGKKSHPSDNEQAKQISPFSPGRSGNPFCFFFKNKKIAMNNGAIFSKMTNLSASNYRTRVQSGICHTAT